MAIAADLLNPTTVASRQRLHHCDPQNRATYFAGVTAGVLLCDLGLTASLAAFVLHQGSRISGTPGVTLRKALLETPVVLWFLGYALTVGGALAKGSLSPWPGNWKQVDDHVAWMGEVAVWIGVSVAVLATARLPSSWHVWNLKSWLRFVLTALTGFCVGMLVITLCVESFGCIPLSGPTVPCLPEDFYMAACSGTAACTMGAVVGIVFCMSSSLESPWQQESSDSLILFTSLLVMAVMLSCFEYNAARFYGTAVRLDYFQATSPKGHDYAIVGACFQTVGLIGGGSYATAGVAASVEASAGRETRRTGASSLATCASCFAVASSAWCAGGVLALATHQGGPASCILPDAAQASLLGDPEMAALLPLVDDFSGSGSVGLPFLVARMPADDEQRKKSWHQQVIAAALQLWAPAVLGVLLFGTAGQALGTVDRLPELSPQRPQTPPGPEDGAIGRAAAAGQDVAGGLVDIAAPAGAQGEMGIELVPTSAWSRVE